MSCLENSNDYTLDLVAFVRHVMGNLRSDIHGAITVTAHVCNMPSIQHKNHIPAVLSSCDS